MEKKWVASVIPLSEESIKDRPKLTIPQQVAYMRDVKGIGFTIVDAPAAEKFLRDSNYYFKIKAFEKNYSKYSNGENQGKYYNLEFAYLQELSTLDMYLREQVFSMTVDIEHYLKVRLINDISGNEAEDGYSIVQEFLSWHPLVKNSIKEKAQNSYCEDLIRKYEGHFAVWNIVEVLSFGDFLNLCEVYYSKYPKGAVKVGTYRIVKFLRNAAAHNNCLINNLADNSGEGFSQNREANAYIASIKGISSKTRSKKMGNRFIHDFVVMLYCFDSIVSSRGVKKHQISKLQQLLDERFVKHREYFSDNMLLRSNYEFVKKVVDKFAESCV